MVTFNKMAEKSNDLPNLNDLRRKNAVYIESTQQNITKFDAFLLQDDDIPAIHAVDDRKKGLISDLKKNLDILKDKLKGVETKLKLDKENNFAAVSLQHLKSEILKNVENLQKTTEEMESEFKKANEDAVNKIQIMRAKHAILQHWSAMEIKTSKDKAVIFVFKQIHPEKPENTYAVQVKTIENEYTATTTVDIPGLDTLLKDLNNSNDLNRFVAEVRKKFVSHVTQHK